MTTNREWIATEFPGLIIGPDSIRGNIEVHAEYDPVTLQFRPLAEENDEVVGKFVMREIFEIEIKERPDALTSRLPALLVNGVDPIPDRHFNQTDKSACLCSPLEEDRFLVPEFNLQRFMKELVIPFLYAQIYFTKHQNWPWTGYSHGALGILESYLKISESEKAKETITVLSRDRAAWPKIKRLLESKLEMRGHTPCVCEKGDHSRRCHKKAMAGLSKLREDVNLQNLKF